MAIMINCAIDWTYDKFVADCKKYNATPIKGVHPSRNASDEEFFIVWLKNLARDFRADFRAKNNGKDYDGSHYVGDYFKQELRDAYFSDYYKDTYGQRPHLDMWYYIYVLGLPTGSDIIHTFCSHPIENASENAKRVRETLEREL